MFVLSFFKCNSTEFNLKRRRKKKCCLLLCTPPDPEWMQMSLMARKKKIGNLFDRHKKIILIVGLAIGVGFLSYQTYECKFLKSCVCVVLRRTSSQRLYVCSLSARKKYTWFLNDNLKTNSFCTVSWEPGGPTEYLWMDKRQAISIINVGLMLWERDACHLVMHAINSPQQRQTGQRKFILIILIEIQTEWCEYHPELLPARTVFEFAQQITGQMMFGWGEKIA